MPTERESTATRLNDLTPTKGSIGQQILGIKPGVLQSPRKTFTYLQQKEGWSFTIQASPKPRCHSSVLSDSQHGLALAKTASRGQSRVAHIPDPNCCSPRPFRG